LNKVIYIVESRFTERDFSRFGVQHFLNKGVDVFVWDIMAIMNSKAAQAIDKSVACGYRNIEYFENQKALTKSIMQLEGSVFILSFIPYHLNSFSLYRAMSIKGISYSLIRAYTNIFADTAGIVSGSRSFIGILSKIISIMPLMNKLLTNIPLSVLGVSPAKFVFTGGLKSNVSDLLITEKTEIVPIHTLDYDEFLKEKPKPILNHDYIVFVDQDLPQHYDSLFNSQPAVVSKQKYYKELDDYFQYLEHKYSVPIVVALHPRADLTKAKENFLGRKVVVRKTGALIKTALFAIVHYSNAINYCVLHKKPFVLTTTDELEVSDDAVFVRVLEKFFSKVAINLSKKQYVTMPFSLDVDANNYSQYKRDFIKANDDHDDEFWVVAIEKIGI
jgi:hypothetical protein